MNEIQFRDRVRILEEPVTDKKPPHWEYWRHELWKHFTNGDDPSSFMGWPCIYHTMLVNHWIEPIYYEFSQIEWDKWAEFIVSPTQFAPIDSHSDTKFSRNLIHQAYHIHVWEQKTGRRIEDLNKIVEFGGGYGAMALLCKRAGFKGKYYIYDLPEFALLQEFFLSHEGIRGVSWPKSDRKKQVDLILGLYSLSEIAMPVRDDFLNRITADSYLMLFSGHWQDYDNVAYFARQTHLAENWDAWEIQHLPDRDNWYTVGW